MRFGQGPGQMTWPRNERSLRRHLSSSKLKARVVLEDPATDGDLSGFDVVA